MRAEACDWNACIFRSDDAVRDVTLVYDGRAFFKPKVHLCREHMEVFGRTGRINMRPEILYASIPVQ